MKQIYVSVEFIRTIFAEWTVGETLRCNYANVFHIFTQLLVRYDNVVLFFFP